MSSSSSNTQSKRNRDLRPGDLAMPNMPPRNQGVVGGGGGASSSSSSSSSSAAAAGARKRKREGATNGTVKAEDSDAAAAAAAAAIEWGSDDHQVVDLVDKEEVPAEILQQRKKKEAEAAGGEGAGKSRNLVKLSAFNCVICMDEAKDLTVTHCGHLFCSECLHSALNIDSSRRICPICRQKIDRLPASGKFGPKAKGYYPLELKLMTKKTLGKRPDQQQQQQRQP